MKILRFIVNLFLAIDQLANTLLLGHPDETLSSRLGKAKGRERYFWVKLFRLTVNGLFFFDKEVDSDSGKVLRHCEKSVMPLEQRNFREHAQYELWKWHK